MTAWQHLARLPDRWSWRKFWLDAAASAALLFALRFAALWHGHIPPFWTAWGAAILVPVVAASTQGFRYRGTAYGGWLFVIVFIFDVYAIALDPTEWSRLGVSNAAVGFFPHAYLELTRNGDGFKDAYILLSIASFTLTGLTFVAVKSVSRTVAVRLTLIANAYAFVFLLSITAIMQRDEGWHRLTLISIVNATAIVGLAVDHSSSIVDYAKDSEATVEFWLRHADIVRGLSPLSYVGLGLMPILPTLGEVIFVLTLSFVVVRSTRATYFLYLSSQLQALDQNIVLRNLFSLGLSKRTRRGIAAAEHLRTRTTSRVATVAWSTRPESSQPNSDGDAGATT